MDRYLDEGFLLDKKIGVNQPKRIENARILIANTAMDTDKIKIFGSRVRVDSVAKVAEIEEAEKRKMAAKVTLSSPPLSPPPPLALSSYQKYVSNFLINICSTLNVLF